MKIMIANLLEVKDCLESFQKEEWLDENDLEEERNGQRKYEFDTITLPLPLNLLAGDITRSNNSYHARVYLTSGQKTFPHTKNKLVEEFNKAGYEYKPIRAKGQGYVLKNRRGRKETVATIFSANNDTYRIISVGCSGALERMFNEEDFQEGMWDLMNSTNMLVNSFLGRENRFKHDSLYLH